MKRDHVAVVGACVAVAFGLLFGGYGLATSLARDDELKKQGVKIAEVELRGYLGRAMNLKAVPPGTYTVIAVAENWFAILKGSPTIPAGAEVSYFINEAPGLKPGDIVDR